MRILIADDNAVVRRALRQVVEAREDFEVCAEAQDGYDAIEQAIQYKPDLVLLDLVMPNLDGLKAAARISELLPGTRMVMVTLHDSPQVRADAKKVGILQVIPKFDASSLRRIVDALLETKLTADATGAERLLTPK